MTGVKWARRPLGAVADLSLGKMLDQHKNRGDFFPYLANVNVRWGAFALEGLRSMRFQPSEIERYCLKSGDIVMCEGGEPGRCAIWKGQIPGMMIQKALHRIRPCANLDNRFLFYSFLRLGQSKAFDRYCTGSTIKHLPQDKLAKVEIEIPPLLVQQRIANILSGYDDLIENSQRRIQVLEAMVRATYREWFVHFRVPEHGTHRRVASPLGDIPVGWQVATLRSVTRKIGSGATPRGGKESYKTHGIPLIRSLNVYDYSFDFADLAYVDDDQATALSSVAIQENDILLNITGASVGRCALVPSHLLPARVNQHVAIVRAEPGGANALYLLDAINSENRKAQLLALAQGGATREALTKETISAFEVLLPPRPLMERYLTVVQPIHRQRELLARQIQILRQSRDLLLPRLLSGEIDLNTA